jgi:transcriptional regulator GlxA family with amidase domain
MISLGERPMAVSEKCGFGDYTTFYRAYRQFFGYAPSSHTAELESRPNENMNIK